MEKSISKNYLYYLSMQLSNILIPLITIPYVSRILLKEGMGIFAFASSIVRYFFLLAMLGIALYGNRAVAYTRHDEYAVSKTFWEIFFIKLITSSFSITLYLLLIQRADFANNIVFLFFTLTLFTAAIDISWLFTGFEDFKRIAFRTILTRILSLILILCLIKKREHVGLYVLINTGSNFLGQAILWSYVTRYVKFIKPTLKGILYHLKGTFQLFVPQIATEIYTALDRTMLGLLSESFQVGIYAMPQRLVRVSLTIATSFNVVMRPRMSNLVATHNFETFKAYIKMSFQFISYFSFLIAFGLYAVSPEFIPLFFGKEFIHAITVAKVISPIIILFSWSSLLGNQVLIPMGKDSWYTLSIGTGAIINFLFNLLLIPVYGALGAAIASVIAEACVMFSQLLLVNRIFKVRNFFGEIWKNLLGGGIMAITIRLLALLPIGIFFKVLVELIVGAFTYVFVETVLKTEINILMIRKIKSTLRAYLKRKS